MMHSAPPAVRRPLLAALLVLAPLTVHAAGPVAPGAGTLLQEVQPVLPATPSSRGTGLTIERQGGVKLPPSAPFEVKSIRISGNTLFDTPTLHALVADAEGKSLTLSQLDQLATRITDYYHAHGYPLTRAIIPAQVIREGVVEIEIIEARYGKISLANRSRVIDSLLEDTLATLKSAQAIDQPSLDHALLLLSDIPGVEASATLRPGETVGTSDLLVAADPGPAASGNVALDNFGNRYTGRERLGATANFNNPLHHGDYLGLSGLTSGSGMNYVRVAYDTLLNGRGTRLGGAYSALRYVLGDSLAALNGHGSAEVAGLWLKHPLLRTRDVNVNGQIQVEQLKLKDHIDVSSIRTDRHLGDWTASLSGDERDTFLAGAFSTWNLAWTAGHLGFDDAQAQLADAATAKTQGSFTKWNAGAARLQGLTPASVLYLTVSAQWAGSNLDAARKIAVGGPYSVRAYDTGAVSGDSGVMGSAEFRHELGSFWNGQWQAVAFVDSAHVTLNKTVWVAGDNSATLSGAGLGLYWSGPDRWSVRTYLAAPLGPKPALLASNTSARAWLEINRGF